MYIWSLNLNGDLQSAPNIGDARVSISDLHARFPSPKPNSSFRFQASMTKVVLWNHSL